MGTQGGAGATGSRQSSIAGTAGSTARFPETAGRFLGKRGKLEGLRHAAAAEKQDEPIARLKDLVATITTTADIIQIVDFQKHEQKQKILCIR